MLIGLRILTLHCSLGISRKTGDNIVMKKTTNFQALFNCVPIYFHPVFSLGKFNQRAEEVVKIRHILNMTPKSEFQTLAKVQLTLRSSRLQRLGLLNMALIQLGFSWLDSFN